jgi:hypothetical protein
MNWQISSTWPYIVYQALLGEWKALAWNDGKRWRWSSVHTNGANIAGYGYALDLPHAQALAAEAINKRTA